MKNDVLTAVGWSNKTDAEEAGREASETALAKLSSRKAQLVIVLGSLWFDQDSLLEGIHSVLGNTPLVGQSTSGEILPNGPSVHSCAVLLIGAEGVACGLGLGEKADQAPRQAGQQAAYAAVQELRGANRNGFLLFGDGLLTGHVDTIRGAQEVLGTNALILGGLTGDDPRSRHTCQYFRNRIVNRSIVGALLSGPLAIRAGMAHGFAPISKPRLVTRSSGNVLHQLDKKPAATVYGEYFSPDIVCRMREESAFRHTLAYPFGIRLHQTQQHWLLRSVLSFGEDNSLICNGDIPQGSWLQLMIGNRESILEAAHRATQQAIQGIKSLSCVLVFDSVIRRKLLGTRYLPLEIDRIRSVVGPSVPIVGCYTYSEQASMNEPSENGALPGQRQVLTQSGSILIIAMGT